MEKLAPNDQTKIQKILDYYTEYRKTHYDDTIGIENENKRRQEEQREIDKQIQIVENIKQTESYVLLAHEKQDINNQIVNYENTVYDIRNTYEEYKHYEDIMDDTEEVKSIFDKIQTLYDTIETIERKQREFIQANGIDIDADWFKTKIIL